jgi:hypothetical protein
MLSESIRSSLFTICILGAVFAPFWYIGTTIVCVSLKNAPSSTTKTYMYIVAWISNIFIVVFWSTVITMILFGVGRTSGGGSHGPIPEFAIGAQAVLGTGLPVWIALVASYFYLADATFRGAFGPLKNTLASPLALRGVHLFTNVSSLLLFPPLVFVGVPLVLFKLRDAPKHARRTVTIVGALSIVFLVLFAVVTSIAASTSTVHTEIGIIDEDVMCLNEQARQSHMGIPTTNTCQMRTSDITYTLPALSASLYDPFSPGTLVVALIYLAHFGCQLAFTIAADRVILKWIVIELGELAGFDNRDEFVSARQE